MAFQAKQKLPILAQTQGQDLAPMPTTPTDQGSKTTQTVESETSYLDSFFGLEVGMVQGVTIFQIFILAWTLLYTFQSLMQFFELRIYMNDGSMGLEDMGIDGIKRAMYVWWTYLPVLILFVSFIVFRENSWAVILAVFTILSGLIKIYLDLKKLLDSVGYFPWARGITNSIKKLLNIK
jgi:hypothetical protein